MFLPMFNLSISQDLKMASRGDWITQSGCHICSYGKEAICLLINVISPMLTIYNENWVLYRAIWEFGVFSILNRDIWVLGIYYVKS